MNGSKEKSALRGSSRSSHLLEKADRITVAVANRQRCVPIKLAKLRSVVRHVLHAEGVRQATIEIALVDDSAIRQVHKIFLHRDSPTDVITFPLNDPHEPLAGEIVISAETAASVGTRNNIRPEVEVLLYLAHGLLHLCGYDDHTSRDARRMHRRQKELLHQIGCQV